MAGRQVTPNFRKIFPIAVALCATTLTIGCAATLNHSQDYRKKEIMAHTTITTKQVKQPVVRKRRQRKKKPKLKPIKQAPIVSPNSITSAVDLELPTLADSSDTFEQYTDTQEATIPPVPSPSNPMPHYPMEARQEGIQGKVVVRVFVGEYGFVIKHKIIQSNKHFDPEVHKVIREWKFTPAKQKGIPVDYWVEIPFNFVL